MLIRDFCVFSDFYENYFTRRGYYVSQKAQIPQKGRVTRG